MKMKPMESEQDFSRFLKRVREEEHVLLKQLAEGLMPASYLARIEKGERPVSKDMRDRMLGRMGIASDLYENLLNIKDHAAWEKQRDILCAVEQQEASRALELIREYEKQAPHKGRIKQQFCLVMRAEVMKQQNVERHKIGSCYEKAVKLTVPDIDHVDIGEKLLSIQEINMVLEYEYYHKGGDFAEKCKTLMTFVEKSRYDDLSKAKIYPKIVYYYLREVFSEQDEHTAEELRESLSVCNRAIDRLGNTGRGFYLLELLEMKVGIIERIEKNIEKGGELQILKLSRKESMEFAELLKWLCEKCDVPAYMQDCTYLYQQRWMFYVGDVLRIRRNMFGLTQEELCEGICSARTLRRVEKKEANMQHEALGMLLRKLGLSKEFQRARLVTNDGEVLKLREKIAVCRNNREPEKAREVLGQIRERVSGEIPENRQYFMEVEASLDWMEGKITKEEFVEREEEALSCTLKVKDLFEMNEVYLTQMEMCCIRKKVQVLEGTEKRKAIDFLQRFFGWYGERSALSDCISMYEFATIRVVSELGNLGEHQSAVNLAKKVLREDLKCKRIWGIDGYLYEISWNEDKLSSENGKIKKNEKMTESLRQCIILSHFCKQDFYEKFYSDKIHYE